MNDPHGITHHTRCRFCNNPVEVDYAEWRMTFRASCDRCKKETQSLPPNTVEWLLMVIKTQVERGLDRHTDCYDHPSQGGPF